MNIANLTIKRPVATIMVLLMVVVLGFMALFKIPMDLMPDFDLPYAMVMTTYSNTSPEEVEALVTETIESAMASVENLNAMVSYSMYKNGHSLRQTQPTHHQELKYIIQTGAIAHVFL